MKVIKNVGQVDRILRVSCGLVLFGARVLGAVNGGSRELPVGSGALLGILVGKRCRSWWVDSSGCPR